MTAPLDCAAACNALIRSDIRAHTSFVDNPLGPNRFRHAVMRELLDPEYRELFEALERMDPLAFADPDNIEVAMDDAHKALDALCRLAEQRISEMERAA